MSSDGDSQKKGVSSNEDLSDLLDSTLKDFTSRPRTTDDELDELMAAQDQAAAQKAAGDFQAMLQQMVQLQEEATRQAQQSGHTNATDDLDTKNMLEAMKQLMYCSGQMANASSADDFMASLEMLRSSDSPMEPFMTMLMQSMASKEVMYPPLKEIHENFPKYFEDHADSLDKESMDRYRKQYDIIGKICAEFEKQESASTEEITLPHEGDKNTSDLTAFETLGKLLVELQSHGYPPKELTGALPNGWTIDENTGMPKVEDVSTAAADACCLM